MLYSALITGNRVSPEDSVLLLPFYELIQEKSLAPKKGFSVDMRRFTVKRGSARVFSTNQRARV